MRFRRYFATVGLCAFVLPTTSRHSAAQSIEIANSLDGSSCYMPLIPPGGSGTAYIYARLGAGPTSSGIQGAEFSILGMPPEMMVSVTPNPASNLTLGNPFVPGCNIAFPSCQTGAPGGIVLLYTVNLTAPPGGVPHYGLQVSPHQQPSMPLFPSPLMVLCDAPIFTKVRVTGGRSGPGPLLAVPSTPTPADGATDVATTTDLAWEFTGPGFCCGIGTSFTNVHFGTTPTPPFLHRYEDVVRSHDLSDLAPHTTYYWSIGWTPDHDCGSTSGGVWSFTTGANVGIETTTWQTVKAMFR